MSTETSPLSTLLPELQGQMLFYLEDKDTKVWFCVCKTFAEMANGELYWQSRLFVNFVFYTGENAPTIPCLDAEIVGLVNKLYEEAGAPARTPEELCKIYEPTPELSTLQALSSFVRQKPKFQWLYVKQMEQSFQFPLKRHPMHDLEWRKENNFPCSDKMQLKLDYAFWLQRDCLQTLFVLEQQSLNANMDDQQKKDCSTCSCYRGHGLEGVHKNHLDILKYRSAFFPTEDFQCFYRFCVALKKNPDFLAELDSVDGMRRKAAAQQQIANVAHQNALQSERSRFTYLLTFVVAIVVFAAIGYLYQSRLLSPSARTI